MSKYLCVCHFKKIKHEEKIANNVHSRCKEDVILWTTNFVKNAFLQLLRFFLLKKEKKRTMKKQNQKKTTKINKINKNKK